MPGRGERDLCGPKRSEYGKKGRGYNGGKNRGIEASRQNKDGEISFRDGQVGKGCLGTWGSLSVLGLSGGKGDNNSGLGQAKKNTNKSSRGTGMTADVVPVTEKQWGQPPV